MGGGPPSGGGGRQIFINNVRLIALGCPSLCRVYYITDGSLTSFRTTLAGKISRTSSVKQVRVGFLLLSHILGNDWF